MDKKISLDGTHEENIEALKEFLGWSEDDDDYIDEKESKNEQNTPKDTK